jgi:hypothetical protein
MFALGVGSAIYKNISNEPRHIITPY